jgi:hypothetical protein
LQFPAVWSGARAGKLQAIPIPETNIADARKGAGDDEALSDYGSANTVSEPPSSV